MEDAEWFSGLDRQEAAAAVVEARVRLLRVEADRLRLVVHWADLHDSETVGDAGTGRVLPGSERAVLLGGDGTPQVAEFAIAELALQMQVSIAAAASMMADGLDLRHRMPLLWQAVLEGSVEAWKARKVAARLRTCGLSQAQAMARFVRTGRSNEYGLSTIVARAASGHAIFFVAMCDRLAQILAIEGDSDSVEVRRSKAIGILADPARALAMLQRHAALDDADDPAEDDEHAPSDDAPSGPEDEAAGSAGSFGTHCGTCGATVGDPTAFVRPMRVDPAKLRPAATLYIHTSREAWDAARGADAARAGGVARIEGVGPVTVAQAVEMLGHANVTVREVIDLEQDHPVDGYEVPDRIREVLLHRSPATVFPWGPRSCRGHDADHTVPYLSPDKGGPPGQTRIANLGFLDRAAHRVKTHASGWRHHQPEPGVHYWRTPTGSWFRVDQHGSHPLGRHRTLPWQTPQAPRRGRIEAIWPRQAESPYELALTDLLAG